jgi:hypothetical protein
VSVWVHALPSLQVDPLIFGGFEHTPVPVLQTPTSWHWSDAVHVTELAPVQTPAWQVSVWVHALPSLQVEPFGLSASVQVPVAELHAES